MDHRQSLMTTAYIAVMGSLMLTSTLAEARIPPAPAPSPAYTEDARPQSLLEKLLANSPNAVQDPAMDCACNPSVLATTGQCKPLRLPTPFSCQVDPWYPLQEYPRPQLLRSAWMNLNGLWQWDSAPSWDAGLPPFNCTLEHKIVVPFPIPSDLSGVLPPHNAGVSRMWYRTTFTVPDSAEWQGNSTRILLNFGAVDFEAEVWVNGVRLGQHRGGYDKFSFDIHDALWTRNITTDEHELIVRVFDPTEYAHIPLGKQRLHVPGRDIFYSGSAGIWQTVWIEPVSAAHVTNLDLVTKVPKSGAPSVQVTVRGSKAAANLPAYVMIHLRNDDGSSGQMWVSGNGTVGTPFNISLPNARLWSPQDPYLYNVHVDILNNASSDGQVLDTVLGYTGVREFTLQKITAEGPLRIFLNNEPLLAVGLLDQGYWPDGLYTAPIDQALELDIDMPLALNLTVLRKHVKVETDRWYYHCDRKGMIVWQDAVAIFWEKPWTEKEGYRSEPEKHQFELELKRMVEEHVSHPSIAMYTVFNEGWGQYDTQRVVQWAKSLDPSRLWDAASGWEDPQDRISYKDPGNKAYHHYVGYVGDIRDDHNYPDPISSGATSTRASVSGEFGGLGLFIPGHAWIGSVNDAFAAYPIKDNSTAMQSDFINLVHTWRDLARGYQGSSMAIYTEVSDTESEMNGIMTYDRKVLKFVDPALVASEIGMAVDTSLLSD